MEPLRLWVARLLVLSSCTIILGSILQFLTGTSVTIVSESLALTAFVFSFLFVIAFFQFLYEIIFKRFIRGGEGIPFLGFVLSSLLFIWMDLSYLSQIYNLDFFTSTGSTIALVLLTLSLLTFSFLTDDVVDTLYHNSYARSTAWFFAGGSCTSAILLIIAGGLALFGIEVIDRIDVLLLSGFIVGAVTLAISVFETQQRVGGCISQITFFSELLAENGMKQSLLLDSVTPYNRGYVIQDTIMTKELMEENYPWLLLTLSSFLILLVSLIIGLFTINVGTSLLGVLLLGAMTAFILWITVVIIIEIYSINDDYKEWRRLWSDFADLVKLRSMSVDAAMIEFTHRIKLEYFMEHRIVSEKIPQIVRNLLESLSRTEKIPDNHNEQEDLLINIILYKMLKSKLDDPHELSTELEGELKYLEKAKSIFDSVYDLLEEGVRERLAFGVFLSSLPDRFELPIEMFRDIVPILTSEWKKDDEIHSKCMDHLEFLETTPRRIVPNSLKWIPSVLSVALWLSVILLV